MSPSDTETRYFTETGQPLLTAAQAAHLAGVKPGTIRQWVGRGYLEVAGLDEQARNLFAAGDVDAARQKVRPYHRKAAA